MRHPVILATLLVWSVTSVAWGADSGSIWGKVTDQTRASLPGVTVTVVGPNLMGAAESVTNDQGVYRFQSLPPGIFKLTFTLPGFNTLIREGIQLTANFTATVDVQLQLSSISETVEVTGLSPVVDAVNTRVQTTWNKEALASVPSARDLWSILSESPAIQMQNRFDVGGSTAGTQTSYRAYGVSGQNKPQVEGVIALEGSNSPGFYYDYGSFDEVNVGAASQGAEMATPGVQLVFVSKSGGNTYHGDFYADYENHGLEGKNIDAKQIAKNVVPDTNRIDNIADLNAGAGGFIKKDKIWWFGSVRREKLEVRQPNLPTALFLTKLYNGTGKVTYQLSKNNRFIAYTMYGVKRQPFRMVALSVTGSTAIYSNPNSTIEQYNPGWVWKGEWNRTFGSNLFLEARVGSWADRWHYNPHTDEARREDLVTQVVTGGTYRWFQLQDRPQTTGALTYSKDAWGGSHNFKFGWEIQKEDVEQIWYEAYPGNVVNVFRNGAPAEVYLLLAPLDSVNRLYWNGFYATDTLTRGPVSVNAGVRFDHYRSAYPRQTRPANQFAPALDISAADNLVTWNELAPRLGASWRLNDRTVLKGNFGRYYYNPSLTVPNAVNPNTSPQWTRYSWTTDPNGNRTWDAGEEGAVLSRRGAGSPAVLASSLKNPHVDEAATWLEREVGKDFGLRAGFVYKRSTDLFLTVNALNPFGAFTTPTTVVDPGLDGVSGTSDDGVLHLFNLDSTLIGKTQTTLENAPDYVARAATVEIAASRRLRDGWSLAASYAVTWRNDFNAVAVNPNQAPQSDMLPISTLKLSGSVDPGWGLRLTPVVRYQQGDPFARAVSAKLNYGSESVLAEPMGSERKDAVLIVDVRTERKFELSGATSIGVFLDAFNIFNSNAASAIITTTGSSFLRPTTILAPRVFRFGGKFSF